jgi:hypothetical protein
VDAQASRVPQRSKAGMAMSCTGTGISVHNNFEDDTVEIRRTVDGVPMVAKIRRDIVNDATLRKGVETGLRELGLSLNEYEINRLLVPVCQAGTANNEVNPYMGINPFNSYGMGYSVGYSDQRAMQNAARAYCKLPPPFPRSEATQDTIMIRRVNARIGLAYDKKIRHYKHIGIGLVAAFVLPWLVAIFIRSWGFCMAWIAS